MADEKQKKTLSFESQDAAFFAQQFVGGDADYDEETGKTVLTPSLKEAAVNIAVPVGAGYVAGVVGGVVKDIVVNKKAEKAAAEAVTDSTEQATY